MLKIVFATLLAVALAAAAAAACVVYFGVYDVSATKQHTQFVYTAMEQALQASVQLRARDIKEPASSAEMLLRGAACYQGNCVQCHGGPSVAPGAVAKAMQPHPGPLVDASRRWRDREIYWITRHGIKMTGMPAWEMRLSDADLWAVARFVASLPELSPEAYAERIASSSGQRCEDTASSARAVRDREDVRQLGFQALREHACLSCHVIPGLTGSNTQVGPPLAGMGSRTLIAGHLPNTEDNLVRWIREPQAVKPGTAMPDMRVSEAHARAIAVYLSTLR